MALKINNKRTYTIDDYINDRNRPAMYVGSNTAGLRQVSGSRADQYRNMMASQVKVNPVAAGSVPLWNYGEADKVETGLGPMLVPPGVIKPGQTSGAGHGTPTVEVTAGGEVAGSSAAVTPIKPSNNAGTSASGGGATESGGETVGEGLTEGEVSSIIVTSDTKNKMDASLQGLIAMAQRGFKYNEKESPLYSILQKQMADEARLASGRAYSRAVANAGGFGSSYATLAAEEASRQVMEGWDEQQLALYQAAKEEWDSQFQSKLDEYNLLSTQYQQEKAEADEANTLLSSAMAAVRESYGAEYIESAIRADLEAMGLSEEQIVQILANQKSYSEAMKAGMLTTETAIESLRGKYKEDEYNEEQMTLYLQSLGYGDEAIKGALDYWSQYKAAGNAGGGSETISGTAQEAVALLQDGFNGEYNPTAMEQYLKTLGIVGEDATDAIEQYRLLLKATVSDYSPTSVSDAISNARELKYSYEKGVLTVEEYDAAVEKNGAYIMKNVSLATSDLDEVDHRALGITDEEWNEMEDGEKKLAVFERAGQMAKSYIISPNQFYKLIHTDLTSEFESPEYQDDSPNKKMMVWINSAKMIESFYESGYLNQDDYIDFTYNVIGEKMMDDPAWKRFLGEIKKALETNSGLSQTEYEGRNRLMEYPNRLFRYGKTNKEDKENRGLVFNMAKFMVLHGWADDE